MASTITYFHEDYTVAWLCALPLEMAVAEAMLDETHPSLPTDLTDNNTYTLGKVCDHNVVIACLRSGVYGTTSAAIVATKLQSTFKSIRFFLMVGIGGGAPSNRADIRLGDVVVSKPTGNFGGVVQYDYGKTMAGGRFEHTGMLNKPLPVLLTAVSRLESSHRSTPSRIPTLISEMVQRHPTMAERFTYRSQDQDQLFDAEYIHCGAESTCDGCDTERLVIRPIRSRCDPVVHHGLIASGNQVMKDACTRDMLSRDYGILCFEMEAAGLMDDFQCLVIRGICDYSDSHKNKQWQEYAAATAAAYAKELLSVVHTVQVVDASLSRSHKDFYCESNLFSGAGRATDTMVCRSDGQDHGVPLFKISSYDHERVHQRLLQKRLIGTTQWFHDHPDFKGWFTEKSISNLWLSGKIGSGKTIIVTTVVEAALCRQSKCRSPTVYFYCENDRPETLDTAYILCSFIRQLCEYLCLTARPYPENAVKMIRKFFGPERVQPDLVDLTSIFTLLFKNVTDAVYIIDGLDALEKKHSKSFLERIRPLCSSSGLKNSRFLLSSREQVPGYINIATFIPDIRRISTHTNVLPDIKVYIDTSITDKTLLRKITDNAVLLEEIKQRLLDQSLEMFLWVSLQLEILWDTCYTDAEIRSALTRLPKGLEETYCRCIHRISPRDKYASKVLKWVSFAIRPLHIEELREAVAMTLDDTEWNPEKMPQRDVLIGCCANLVVVDHFDSCVRFAHSSVKQYLENHLNKAQPEAAVSYPTAQQGDIECGELCVTYLSFSNFSLQLTKRSIINKTIPLPLPSLIAQQTLFHHVKSVHRFFSRPRAQLHDVSVPFYTIRTSSTPDKTQYRFLDYAVANWAMHTKQLSNTSMVWVKFRTLATSFNETWNFHPWPPGGRSKVSLLHALFGWAVKENHEPLLSIALATGPSLHLICNLPLIGEGLPALHVACKLGYRSITELLLIVCDRKVRDLEGYTPLHHAASGGHVEICQLLLSKRTMEVDALTRLGCTPLWLAASNGHHEVVSLLHELRSDFEIKAGDFSQTALSKASENGHYEVVQQLVNNGASLESRDSIDRTPLSWAARNGYEAVVKLLLDRGAGLESRSNNGRTPLSWAARNGREVVVELLLDRGADLESRDNYGQTPLSQALLNGHKAAAKLLLNRGANLESRDNYGQTPLSRASFNGQKGTVKLLLDMGANPKFRDNNGHTPLSWASRKGYEAVAKLLMDSGANMESRDCSGQTPLFWAFREQHGVMIKLLLGRGADLESRNNSGQTPLSWASQHRYEAVIKLLLAIGANLESRDNDGRTPLSWASRNRQEGIVKLLLDRGADLESRDNGGWTPLSWASRNGHEAVIKLLLDRGANLESRDDYSLTPLSWASRNGREAVIKLLLDRGADLESRSSYGRTPLSWVSKNGDKAAIKLLLDRGANLESRDNYGRTPLSWATLNECDPTTGRLLDRGADLESRDDFYMIPIFPEAAQNRRAAIAKLLLDRGADLESRDDDGRTPLSWASLNKQEAIVKLLLNRGANLESRDNYSLTPLSWASRKQHGAMVKLLLDMGANLESKDCSGQTPLSWASRYGHEVVIKLLLDRGADLETRDNNGQTPLFWASEHGHEAVVKLLLDRGADHNSRDNHGNTFLF